MPDLELLVASETIAPLAMSITIYGPTGHTLTFTEIENLVNQFMQTVKGSVTWPPPVPLP